ncbi:MAG TPA: hypothetical protein VLK22_04565 [Candidatus Udaeobacter sp.]|nr:hypothetical protein [Candidatus Udaeobacter sp.]
MDILRALHAVGVFQRSGYRYEELADLDTAERLGVAQAVCDNEIFWRRVVPADFGLEGSTHATNRENSWDWLEQLLNQLADK